MQKLKRRFWERTGVTLWDYQLEDAKKMAAGHFGCFQDPGLGKTFTALAAILSLEMPMADPHTVKTVVWIGPKLSLIMVRENIHKIWPGCVVQIIRKGADVVDPHAAFVLTSPDLIRNAAIREALIRLQTDIVVVDEMHRFKTHDSARTRALYGEELDCIGGITQDVDHVWLLSGTPMPNGLPGEMFPHLTALWPQAIEYEGTRVNLHKHPMSHWQFRNLYHHLSILSVKGRKVTVDRGAKNTELFKEKTSELWTRRLIRDYLNLAEPLIEETVLAPADVTGKPDDVFAMSDGKVIGVPPAIKKLFENLTLKNLMHDLPEAQSASLMRLTGCFKVRPTVDLIKDLLEDGVEQVLVGFWHRDVGASVASWLASELGEHVGVVDGGTLTGDANAVITKFQNKKMRVLCGQIATMGETHNLQQCHRVVMAEQSVVPGQNKQFIMRCQRQGQLSRVVVNSVIIKGSLDENVCRTLTRKMKDQTSTMETT